jgi:hypothetical protein
MITYEMVRDTVQVLIAAGKEPSRKRVHDRLGEGSYETIGKMIDKAKMELNYQSPVALLDEDESADDPPGAGYTPPTPDAGEVEHHLSTLRTRTAIAAARSHLAGLCAAWRCQEPALEQVQPHLHQQYLAAVLAAGPISPASLMRPPYQLPLDTLTRQAPEMLQAAEALLGLLEPPASSGQEAQHGPTAA